MNWKKYMALLLAAGMAFSTPAAVYANENAVPAAQDAGQSTVESGDGGTVYGTPAADSAGQPDGGAEDTGGDAAAGSAGDAPDADESGESGTDSGNGGSSDASGEDNGTGGGSDASGEDSSTGGGSDASSGTEGSGNASGADSGATEADVLKAGNEKGVLTALSEKTLALVKAGKAEIRDGWLLDKATGKKLDPVTGAELVLQTETGTDGNTAGSDGSEKNAVGVRNSSNAGSSAGKGASGSGAPARPAVAAGQEAGSRSVDTTAPGEIVQGRAASGADAAASVPAKMIVPSPVAVREFRFYTVAQDPAVAKKKLPVREACAPNARTVGLLPEGGVCYILQEEADGWLYVESGSVRGFVRKQLLYTGVRAEAILRMETVASSLAGKLRLSKADTTEEVYRPTAAEEKIPREENAAFTHTRTTVYQSVTEKDPALARTDVQVMEKADGNARAVGTLKGGALAYVVADRDRPWVYVESGDVRGFVPSEKLVFSDAVLNRDGKTLKDQVAARGEETYPLASELVPAEENAALYYSMLSVRSGAPGSAQREAVLSYAAQFIGNPYVWGGTDPVNGADCSGFVQTVYRQFGYDLPRTAAEQAVSAEKIPVSEALPGDLVFYSNGSRIYHVVICAGGDKTLEAKGKKYGIVSGTLDKKHAAWAIRVIDDTDALQYDIPAGLGSIHTYMGWQKITNVSSQQYAFREAAGMSFDPEGFAVVDNRYVIACTDTFGAIGDYVDFYQADGTKIPCVIGDFKSRRDAGCTGWGHMGGRCMVEFVVDQDTWYRPHHANPGTAACHPEWNQEIVKAEKVGSFYSL